MRILLISQYFWPENFRINDLCIGLKESGHVITVLTGKPNYPNGKYFNGYNFFNKKIEYWNGIKIYRSNLILRGNGHGLKLFLNYFSFAISASFKIFFIKEKFDKVFIFAPSPITVALPGIIASRIFKTKSYLWIHDLWPESIRSAGGIENKLVLGVFNLLTKYIYSKIDILLIQSHGFLSYLNQQKVNENKIIYYPFYAEEFYKVENSKIEYKNQLPEGFNLIFAGNIGEGQSFPTLLLAAKIIKEKGYNINWIIFGDGRLKDFVKNKIIEYNLDNTFILKNSLPASEMPKFFSCANGLVVSLKNKYIFSITIPGKLQSYLACGKPIIGSLNGVGAEIIEKSKSGFVGKADSPEELADAVLKLYNTPFEMQIQMGMNARIYYEQEFDRNMLLKKLITIFES
jgi:glycosyltransferase involved in cell wall biosynthesis